jgi:ribonuclease D
LPAIPPECEGEEGMARRDGEMIVDTRAAPDEVLGTPHYLKFSGKVVIVYTKGQCDKACADLMTAPRVFWDTEHVPAKGKKVTASLVQIMKDETTAYLFHVSHWKNELYPSFADFWASPDIAKIAHHHKGDVTSVRNRFPDITIENVQELRDVIGLDKKESRKLKDLVDKYVCGAGVCEEMSKTNWWFHKEWNNKPIDWKHQEYAATDVYAYLLLFNKFMMPS